MNDEFTPVEELFLDRAYALSKTWPLRMATLHRVSDRSRLEVRSISLQHLPDASDEREELMYRQAVLADWIILNPRESIVASILEMSLCEYEREQERSESLLGRLAVWRDHRRTPPDELPEYSVRRCCAELTERAFAALSRERQDVRSAERRQLEQRRRRRARSWSEPPLP
jgi:hypothetical protein